jgi:hypothetical protein
LVCDRQIGNLLDLLSKAEIRSGILRQIKIQNSIVCEPPKGLFALEAAQSPAILRKAFVAVSAVA